MGHAKDFLGRGFSFPLTVDSSTGKLKMEEDEDDIRQAVYLILMTRKKERAMLPRFGCNIHRYIFELPDATFEHLICSEIEQALTDYEPRIREVHAEIENADLMKGEVSIRLRYVVRATNNPNNLVFPYFVEEGIGEL